MTLLRNVGFTIGAVMTLIVVLMALTAPWLAPHDPSVQDTSRRLEGPSADHPLGMDDLGRDVLS